jgi:hypothetical protein
MSISRNGTHERDRAQQGHQAGSCAAAYAPSRWAAGTLNRGEAWMEEFQLWSIIAGLVINFVTLLLFLLQTRHLGKQTNMLARSLEYSSYLKLLDYLNDVSKLAIENPKVKEIFSELHFVKDNLVANQNLSMEKIGLAWLVINRYEAAFVGDQLGVLPEGEWKIWENRLRNDVRLPFVRDVWRDDVKNFAYNRGFRDLMNDLIQAESTDHARQPPATRTRRDAGSTPNQGPQADG